LKAKTVNILFLSLYLAAMFRPAIYFIDYFVNYDYIKEELCKNRNKPVLKCNGTCYVEVSLKSANLLTNENSQKTTLPKITVFLPNFIINEFSFNISKVIFLKQLETPKFSKQFVIHRYINEIFRPPKIA